MLGILASIFDGVLVGAVYGLAAMGLTLIWGVMDVVNLTHGTAIVAGMFALYLLTSALGVPPYFALPPVLIGGFLFGVLLYWIAVHRMIGRPPLMSLLSTFAVNLVLIGAGTGLWGTVLFNVAVSLPGVRVERYTFPGTHIIAAVLTIVIAGCLYLFLHRTRLGKGGARGGQQSRGRGADGYPDNPRALSHLRARRRAGRRVGYAHRYPISFHSTVG
jgi:branched-chain amino acid transport system permease protein